MNSRRRHAHDFTDSLNSCRQTTQSTSEQGYSSINTFSEDSLTIYPVRNANNSRFIEPTVLNTAIRSQKHSRILAGSCANKYVENVSSTDTSCNIEGPKAQLDRQINSFSDSLETMDEGERNNKENANPQCREQYTSNRRKDAYRLYDRDPALAKCDILLSGKTDSKSKVVEASNRDTNFNISYRNPQPTYLSNDDDFNGKKSPLEEQGRDIHSTGLENKQLRQSTDEFENVLCDLDNQLNDMKESCNSQPVLKRLTNKFASSPKNFTEKLLSVIEESIVHDNENACEASAINLSRLTIEFRKMCKFIEDETAPEWPPSPLATPLCLNQTNSNGKSQSNKKDRSYFHERSVFQSPNTGSPFTKGSPMCTDRFRTPRKFSKRLSRNISTGSLDNLTDLSFTERSNASFEQLEAQCNRLFQSNQLDAQLQQKAKSFPSLLSMSTIHRICDQQMASLDATENGDNSCNNLPTYKGRVNRNCLSDVQEEERESSQTSNLANMYQEDEHGVAESNCEDDFKSENTKENQKKFLSISPDELEKTLLEDIAIQRKRCLDTAKLIMEINTDSNRDETEKLKSPTCSNEAKFLDTLISCKKYYTYLKRQKPLFDILNSDSFTSNKGTPKPSANNKVGTAKIKSEMEVLKPRNNNTNKSGSTKKSEIRKISKTPTGNTEKTERPKRKFFVTPNKNPRPVELQKKRLLFPDMQKDIKKTPDSILKSPHAKGLYRLNYNTIISPVGMYIRGTDPQLLKNVRANTNTNKYFDTPMKQESKKLSVPKQSVQSSTPRHLYSTQTKLPDKSPAMRSTQKRDTQSECKKTPVTLKTPKSVSNYQLPKVNYELPLQVRTIREEPTDTRQRIKTLLQSMRSKVVVHHQGRLNSVQTKHGENVTKSDEINYRPEDESIHVEHTVAKTNFMHTRKCT